MNQTSKKNEDFIESPCNLAVGLGAEYALEVSQKNKKDKGQFFTSIEIASFMASLSKINFEKKKLRILDPGCGTLTLTCALIESLINRNEGIELIEIDVYETDSLLSSNINKVSNYLKEWCSKKNVEIFINYFQTDFILANMLVFNEGIELTKYNYIISNPPYFKISKDDPRLGIFGYSLKGQQNIYSLFLLISSKLLKKDGQLIYIVPRSFVSGLYFQSFRDYFLENITLQHFHLFSSRADGFKKDKVLQENLIMVATAKKRIDQNQKIKISSSFGVNDLHLAKGKEFSERKLIKRIGKLNVIHLPVNSNEEKAIELFSTWDNNLASFGMKVSTGPVVPFRSKKLLKHKNSSRKECVPLFWMHNCQKMVLKWPYRKPDKQAWIIDNSQSNSKTIVNQNYVFLRRFSSKDDTSKVIATPHLFKNLKFDRLGIENHLNYLYKPDGIIEDVEIFGLSVLFNSSLFDAYFRSIGGSTQVSATELNALALPSLDFIKIIGEKYMSLNGTAMNEIDNIVNETFNLSIN